MKIASWNVNSLKVRLPHVLNWLKSYQPDVLVLQETKLPDEHFPVNELRTAGYAAVFSGQKTYNGVAILSKTEIREVISDIPGYTDPQRRMIAASIGGLRILNLYVVNGSDVGTEKFIYKLNWLNKVTDFIADELTRYQNVIALGDYNIAPEDRDVHDPESWREKILCSTAERKALAKIQSLGLLDTFRLFGQAEASFSWWDYRAAAFRRNLGLRIDLILSSKALAEKCYACGIDKEPRKWERPSDHAPVWAEYNL